MGSASAQSSIERVIRDHEEELKRQLIDQVPVELQPYVEPVLENNTYAIRVAWKVRGLPEMNSDQYAFLEGPEIAIETLAEDFPCCNVGY